MTPNLFQLPDMPVESPVDYPLENIHHIEDLEDGSSLFELHDPNVPQEIEDTRERYFDENLAEYIDSDDLDRLGIRLLDEIDEDKASRKEWDQTVTLAMRYLGFKIEEFRTEPFANACAAFDSTLAIALLRAYSVARAELWPAMGPCKSEIIGQPTEQTEDEGERVKDFMNYYLTQIDLDYYPESERLLLYTILCGCGFRKVYQDPILNRPVARTVNPQNMIINLHTTCLTASTRMTEQMYLTRKDVMLRQNSKDYLHENLPRVVEESDENIASMDKAIRKIEGTSTDGSENKTLFRFYESHVELSDDDLKEFDPYENKDDEDEDAINSISDIPKPYIVTISENNKKIVSIRRNWREGDDTYTKVNHFIHYYYLPGFGIYGLGLAQLMGSNSIALTTIQRQLIDAGTYKNFPGGIRASGMRIENNDKAIGPGEFHEMDTGGLPIQQCLMLMPYGEPSTVLMALRDKLIEQTAMIGATAELPISEMGANAPVGTTLALLETANKVQSSVLRGMHVSLGQELKLIFNLFGEYLEENSPYPFKVPGSETAIMKADFSDRVNIVPTSDPNVMTSTHRLLHAEALLKIAQSAPEIHDMREAYRRMYTAMNVENINQILPPAQEAVPLDPITENMNCLMGKPLRAGIHQNQEAHIITHMPFADKPAMAAHIQEHQALDYLTKMQLSMGIDMPSEQELQNPEIQNEIAMRAAEATKAEQDKAQADQPKPIDPNMILLAEIEQRKEAAQLKHEEARMRQESEAYKAMINLEATKAKIESDLEIAEERNETQLTLAEMKPTKGA